MNIWLLTLFLIWGTCWGIVPQMRNKDMKDCYKQSFMSFGNNQHLIVDFVPHLRSIQWDCTSYEEQRLKIIFICIFYLKYKNWIFNLANHLDLIINSNIQTIIISFYRFRSSKLVLILQKIEISKKTSKKIV